MGEHALRELLNTTVGNFVACNLELSGYSVHRYKGYYLVKLNTETSDNKLVAVEHTFSDTELIASSNPEITIKVKLQDMQRELKQFSKKQEAQHCGSQ